jgi:transglutaminase-like putative cysteine protease
MMRRRRVEDPFRIVAIPAAIALAAIGAIAAGRAHWPALVGAAAGALAAVLTVLALPSISTRRATVLLLGIGGLGALRHAAVPGTNSGYLLVLWAGGTLCTMLLVDRAETETTLPLAGGERLASRAGEATRNAIVVGLLIVIAAVAFVPTITDRLGRHVWPGISPNIGDVFDAPASLRHSNTLDMTSRPRLSNKVVFTVDAARADFWRGETFDVWNGHEWARNDGDAEEYFLGRQGAQVAVPAAPFDVGATEGADFRQTFHVEAGFSDVVFAAPSPRTVQTDKLLKSRGDGAVTVTGGVGGGFGKGAVYSVVSRRTRATADALRAADFEPTPAEILSAEAQVPAATTSRVRALARRITAAAPTNYDKVIAIEDWMGAQTEYSLNAPLSPPGVDVVDDFLFRSKVGWCEQIASSMVVLARSVGIPARLATGFAPGDRDALTGRFVVRERDAHAWAEIYFAGIGWQGFDPTASVPLAGEKPPSGSWMQGVRDHALVFGIAAALVVALTFAGPGLAAAARRRRRRRSSWGARALHRLERAGRKAGRVRAPAETPREYARSVARQLDDARIARVGDVIDADAFSLGGASQDARDAADSVLTSLRP